MKFAIFFLVAACLAQGYQSRVMEVKPNNIADDISEAIRRIVERIQEIIAEIGDDLPEIIRQIEERIREIISNINIDQIIENIRTRIQESIDKILDLAGLNPEDVRECIAAERASLQQLLQDTISAVKVCRQITHDELQGVHKELVELRNRAQQLIQSSAAVVRQCRAEGNNVEEVLSCLRDHRDELRPEAQAVLEQIRAAIEASRGVLIPSHIDHFKCLHQIHQDNIPREQAIIENFRQCVESSRQ